MILKNLKITILLLLVFSIFGCSVADPSKALRAYDPKTPISGDPETPAQPSEPVLVSEPIPVISESPEPELIPTPIAQVDATPTTPAAEIIDVSEVVVVTVPLENSPPEEEQVPELQLQPENNPEDIPGNILDAVEILNPETTPPDNSENHQPETEEISDEKETDFFVTGDCLGKKKVGIIWYDKRNKEHKKNKSVTCKNDKFEIKVKEMKKDLPYLEFQTLFFD